MGESKPHLLRSAKNWVAFFWLVALLQEHSVLFPQLRDLAFEIRLDGRFLTIASVLLSPATQRREANPKIGCHLPTRRAARQRYPHCLSAKFLGWSQCHLCSPLRHDTWSKERHNPATGSDGRSPQRAEAYSCGFRFEIGLNLALLINLFHCLENSDVWQPMRNRPCSVRYQRLFMRVLGRLRWPSRFAIPRRRMAGDHAGQP
jgi:hypothetical protein